MSILRTTVFGLTALSTTALLTMSLTAREQQMSKPDQPHQMSMGAGPTMTKAQKIANAMTAAPASVSGKATILDWPAKEGDAPAVLRAGTNGWTCFPDMADSKGNDPMCIDQAWMSWVEGYMAHKPPVVPRVGLAYMIAPGGAWLSSTDPFATGPTPTNQWGLDGPHLMVLLPDTKALEGLPTDRNSGGPYVMWPGTPYAHIMAPVKDAPAMAK
jgi:hypothetical protein